MSDDKIIPFPKNRIVNQRSRELDEQRRKMGNKVAKEIEKQQTKQFVETSVDEMSMNLLRQFYDMSIKTDKHSFTKDLALLVDVMRGLMYRDFGVKHPAQNLSDKMVNLKVNRDGTQSAQIDYTNVTNTQAQTKKPLSKEIKEDLKDLNETGVKFDPETDFE